jgi:ribosome-associated protein
MLQITNTLALDENEIQQEFFRASGPGGQNVNKVATAVRLRFDVANSPSLPDDVRRRLMRLAGNRLTEEGVLIIEAQRHRTQEKNRQDALERLVALIQQAIQKPKPRRKTKPSAASQERRLAAKQRRSETKRRRRSVPPPEE